MNNDDTISREAAIKALRQWRVAISTEMAVAEVEHLPSVPPQVVHGHPVHHNRPARYEHYEMVQQTEDGEPLYKRQSYMLQDNPVEYCPKCGKRLCSRFTNYCPNCGAKMDGGKDDAAD